MNKETFTKLVNELVSLKADEEVLNTAFQKIEPNFNWISFGRYEQLVVHTLEEAMEDTDGWISWWLYDHKCGKGKMKALDKKGKTLKSKTAGDLYDIMRPTLNKAREITHIEEK